MDRGLWTPWLLKGRFGKRHVKFRTSFHWLLLHRACCLIYFPQNNFLVAIWNWLFWHLFGWLVFACWDFRVWVSIVRVILYHRLHHIGHVQIVQELLHGLLLFLEFDKELLSMTSGLSTWPCAHMHLDLLPLLAIHLESLQESKVFFTCPTTSPFANSQLILGLSRQIGFSSLCIYLTCWWYMLFVFDRFRGGFCGRWPLILLVNAFRGLHGLVNKLNSILRLLQLNLTLQARRRGHCWYNLHLFRIRFRWLREHFWQCFCQIKSRH